ncbi:acetyl/propionyl/methylcrotonyl-CoA carboxylase subunit alpha [Rhodococcus sp. IEGM 1330]|uniref:acetyl/propionyl/methylcrotonyl-CoA carboxylase subunit alpha n=1 Tax=Rhodococcus sp. IEGM 1330 TaxID=3082225 RepID=UPI0029541576|nr:biotin carboxylase N-terminal domain-containing protein [Rhodococcus sp. IEGM 1330]MDV8022194.1 biotin carboxylase N-terminal domain-containing protein [Rhodococcus sp. IEGM 1330]
MQKVLVANRGEIAVRVIRACRDEGLTSVAVYADPDRDAKHVRMADEAYSLGGDTPATSYLDGNAILRAARESGSDSIHPGYGFLSEDADFAQSVVDAGLTWIGPPPAAIRELGDKVSARRIAQAVGAPLTVGTAEPLTGSSQAIAFADQHGLPIAIKAAYGGGGRGMRIVWNRSEISELWAAAVREAVAAFGRGECFVEKYIDRPRHVETQCLADRFGNVVVISTRDCSLQRRHQKLVEEAPAPFLTDAQRNELYRASKAILAKADYVGAGTCEFLIGQDGSLSFLEVNTRLQVEHPVSEEVTGIDLVREMFRVARGEAIGYEDPPSHGHALEFRVNVEDPGRSFLPVPGTVSVFDLPSGPGVRVDSGVEPGSVIGPAWDSLLAKVIVSGVTRDQAIERARRALDEFVVGGVPTTLAFHRAVLNEAAFVKQPLKVHTRWIETDFHNTIPPQIFESSDSIPSQDLRETMVVEISGRRLEVSLPLVHASSPNSSTRRVAPRRVGRTAASAAAGSAGHDALVSPMQGTIVNIAVTEGQRVQAGDLVVVIEAMKMEQPITAHRAGIVRDLSATLGTTVGSGATVCRLDSAESDAA